MKLIGMLDSPYVRRVAITLEALKIPFEHEAVSVFSDFDKFQSINPVVKAPTLICDDGEVIMDSSLILQFAELINSRSLWPRDHAELQHEFRAVSLALAAAEKCVAVYYERNLRPVAAQYEPWIERATGQLLAAFCGLEEVINKHPKNFQSLGHASIAAAVIWRFACTELSEVIRAAQFPALVDLSARMESLPEFLKFPAVGPGVPKV